MLENINQFKLLDTYIDNVAEYGFSKENIVVERRTNNPKRDFLFVNRKQCKHIPGSPRDMIQMCGLLADRIQQSVPKNAKVMVIAFAETATAIGNIVADKLPQCSCVVQTTRELLNGEEIAFEFKEEHSHVTDQRIYSSHLLSEDYDYILLIDDEITTGTTVINFINGLRSVFGKHHSRCCFGVASICNWQSSAARERFRQYGIELFYLLSGTIRDVNQKVCVEKKPLASVAVGATPKRVVTLKIDSMIPERLGHAPNQNICIFTSALSKVKFKGNSIRVVGTEEFMYVPIRVAEFLENQGYAVVCHSTTRSPIDVTCCDCTGIRSGIPLPSVYDAARRTYLYNFRDPTDITLFITDGNVTDKMRGYLSSIFSCKTLIIMCKGE